MPTPHPLLANPERGGDFYFVHSYYVEPGWPAHGVVHADTALADQGGTLYGVTEYAGISFASMAGKGSLFAAQFHPEKSGEIGLDILSRFIQWDGQPC